MQNDVANRYSTITIVMVIISQFNELLYPAEVLISFPEGDLTSDSVALLNQLRSIDKRRFIKRLGVLKPETMEQIDQAIENSMELVRI